MSHYRAECGRVMDMIGTSLKIVVAALGFFVAGATQSLAQGAATPSPFKAEPVESCPGLVAARSPLFQPVALNPDQVRIAYIGHSTFLIESPQGVRIATDYNDYVRPSIVPDIATMNHAHSSHYTDRPDSRIAHVLRGWAENEKPARIDLQVKDVRVRNAPTNIRTFSGDTERHGNSIFIFEIANMCIAHLGHLHHTLTQQQLAEIGRVDVVMVPVDGNMTLDLDGMVEVLHALKAPLMIPMHYFSAYTLDRFLQRVRADWDVEIAEIPSTLISKPALPTRPKVLVLPGH